MNAQTLRQFQAPRVDLSRAFIRTPAYSGAGPTEAPRPKHTRVFPGIIDDEPHPPEDWDEAKRRFGEGTYDPGGRPPWL